MEEKMNVKTYVELAKKELDKFESMWNEEMVKKPKNWPEKLTEMEWAEQEVATRFDLEF